MRVGRFEDHPRLVPEDKAFNPGDEDVLADLTVVVLHGATLKSYAAMANGGGFDVHFIVPLTEKDNLPALTDYLQRLCEIRVSKYSRRRGSVSPHPDDDAQTDVWSGQ